MKVSRIAIIGATIGLGSAAHAFTYFNLASGDLGLTGQSGAQTLTVGGPAIGVQSDTTNGNIDFFPSAPGLAAGDSTGVGFRAYSFTYMVGAPAPVNQVGMVLLGTIGGTGRLSLEEDVFKINADNSETLVGSISNTLFDNGTVLARGAFTLTGSNFTYVDNTPVLPNLANYKVKKSFVLQVTDFGTQAFNPLVDFVSLSLVQQNHSPVPEPASFAVLGVGAIALLRRRRRNR